MYYIHPEAFEREVCKGFDANRVARLLRDLDALVLTDGERREGRLKTRARLPRSGRSKPWVYKVRNSALLADLGGGAA